MFGLDWKQIVMILMVIALLALMFVIANSGTSSLDRLERSEMPPPKSSEEIYNPLPVRIEDRSHDIISADVAKLCASTSSKESEKTGMMVVSAQA